MHKEQAAKLTGHVGKHVLDSIISGLIPINISKHPAAHLEEGI